MSKARTLYRFNVMLAVAGLGTIVLAAFSLARSLSFAQLPLDLVSRACHSLVLPHLGVAGVLALGLATLIAVSLLRGVRALWRESANNHRLIKGLPVGDRVSVGGGVVAVVEAEEPLAFCCGLLRPAVVVSRATLAMPDAELAAVVAHERHHAERRDPLRLLVARVLAEALFFLPAIRRSTDRYAELAEVAADEAAVRHLGDRKPLASALLAFAGPHVAERSVVGISPERVDHLAGQAASWRLSGLALMASGLAAAAIAVAAAVAMTAAGSVNVPLMAAQSCMLLMVGVPLVAALWFLSALAPRLAQNSR